MRLLAHFAASVIFIVLLLTICTVNLFAQNNRSWSSITSFNTVNDIAQSSNGDIWGVSNGGLFSFSNQTFDQQFTPIDGMYRLDGISIYYIEENNKLVIGYLDGMIDLYDIENRSFERIEDIFRVQGFTSKSISDFEIYRDQLFIATDFGIVVYDINSFLVINSFTKIGAFDRGISIQDIHIENESIYVGTQQGVGIADINTNLDIESAWDTYNLNDGLSTETIQSIITFNGSVLASTESSNYRLDNGTWQEFDTLLQYSGVLFKNVTDSGELIAHTSNRVLTIDSEDRLKIINPGLSGVSGVVYDELNTSSIFVSTLTEGMGLSDIETSEFQFFTPDGPNVNFFEGMNYTDDSFISGTTPRSQRNAILDNGKGYYIRDKSGWKNFNINTSTELRQFQFRQAFTTAYTEDYYYIGSWGRGIVRHHIESDEINVFNSSNSSLRGWAADNPNFPVISGLETDSNNAVWATSRFATNPLYLQLPGEDDWINYSKSAAVNSGDEYVKLFIDSYDQKWITLESTGGAGRGLLVLDTGEATQINESAGVKLTDDQGNGNLPDMTVTAVVEDRDGEVWVGTERGIARFIFPQFIVSGTQQERQAQWLINEDQDAASPFLLRDINVTAMAVNAANQKWVGTASEGIWLLNESGSAILKRFTADNSPLFSNVINDIEIYDETGEVYISTELGLSIYRDTPVRSVSSMENLKVYPNPFLYDRHSSISIENLSEVTTIRVLGVDGTLIRTIENRGGRASWDGRDSQGREVGSGVYMVVALGQDGNQRGIGKVAIIR